MRLPFRALLALSLGGLGCCGSTATTGWRFEVLKPPTMSTSAAVVSGPAPLGLAGFGTVAHETSPPYTLAASPCIPPPSGNFAFADLMRRLDAMERRMNTLPPPEQLKGPTPMPKAACVD